MSHHFTEAELEVVKETFSHFDSDGDGFISGKELSMALGSLEHDLVNLRETFTEERMEAMVREVDTDGDGKISFEEFVKLVTEK